MHAHCESLFFSLSPAHVELTWITERAENKVSSVNALLRVDADAVEECVKREGYICVNVCNGGEWDGDGDGWMDRLWAF